MLGDKESRRRQLDRGEQDHQQEDDAVCGWFKWVAIDIGLIERARALCDSAMKASSSSSSSSCSSCSSIFITFLLLVSISLVAPPSPAAAAAASASSCPELCGSTVLPFPFGLSRCGLPSFHLSCHPNSSSLSLPLSPSSSFPVLSISSQSLVLDPLLSSSCHSPNAHFFLHSSFHLPFLLSPNNVIMMFNCSNFTLCDCSFHSQIDGLLRLQPPSSCPSSCWCGLLRNRTLQSLMSSFGNCSSFISWAVLNETGNAKQMKLQIQWGLELQVMVPGPCSCSKEAECVRLPDGHSCKCKQGFVGDGFAKGEGCRVNAKTCNRDSFVGCAKNVYVLVAGLVAGTAIIVVLILSCVLLRRRNFRSGDSKNRRDIKQIEGLICGHGVTKLFAYKDLEKATKGFSEQQKLGNGAFGTVYAGKLQEGRLVAVKRINYRYMQGIQQVVNEVKVLSAVNHPNLVRLLGCCLEYGDPLLVYEYIPNGTLAEHLQGQRGDRLTWSRRVTIAFETAQALAYLHSLKPPIYHRDVKSSNILLDYDFTSKVADFGLSRLVLTENSHISTVPQGTPGYLDPEYHQNFHLSDKSDVYSFGVVLVEIVTAMKAVDFTREKSEINLANLALARIGNGTLDGIIDVGLEAGKNPQIRAMIQLVAEVAYRCLSYDKDARPTIKEVANELEFIKNETKKFRMPRQLSDKSRTHQRSTKKESSAKVRAVSCSSIEEVWASNDSSSNSA